MSHRKAVVRRLPPLLPEPVFTALLPESPGTIIDYYYRPGSLKSKQPKYSRAYITFASHSLLYSFIRAFAGHIFKDSAGIEYHPVVEIAIFQKPSRPPKRPDPRRNTILTDDHYLDFVASLNSPPPLIQPPPSSPPLSTPLLDYLAAQKKAQIEKKAAAIGKAKTQRPVVQKPQVQHPKSTPKILKNPKSEPDSTQAPSRGRPRGQRPFRARPKSST